MLSGRTPQKPTLPTAEENVGDLDALRTLVGRGHGTNPVVLVTIFLCLGPHHVDGGCRCPCSIRLSQQETHGSGSFAELLLGAGGKYLLYVTLPIL